MFWFSTFLLHYSGFLPGWGHLQLKSVPMHPEVNQTFHLFISTEWLIKTKQFRSISTSIHSEFNVTQIPSANMRGRIYDLYCSQSPGDDQHVLASCLARSYVFNFTYSHRVRQHLTHKFKYAVWPCVKLKFSHLNSTVKQQLSASRTSPKSPPANQCGPVDVWPSWNRWVTKWWLIFGHFHHLQDQVATQPQLREQRATRLCANKDVFCSTSSSDSEADTSAEQNHWPRLSLSPPSVCVRAPLAHKSLS